MQWNGKRVLSALFLIGTLLCAGRVSHADDCGTETRPSRYQQQPGDSADSTHLSVSRKVPGAEAIEINVCSGELRLDRSTQSDVLRIEASSPGADQSLAHYLQDFETSGNHAVISVRIPSKYHAIVTVYIPRASALQSEVNLGAGTLLLHAGVLQGDRKLNIGAGKAVLYLDGDRDYSDLQANVGMGKMTDNRPGGHNAYTVISRNLAGHGQGSLQVNVGAGELDLEPAEN